VRRRLSLVIGGHQRTLNVVCGRGCGERAKGKVPHSVADAIYVEQDQLRSGRKSDYK
jgi:hypothetical protein